MNFTKKCPIITNMQVPKEDEYGLWLEIDFLFKGEVSAKVRTSGMRIDEAK